MRFVQEKLLNYLEPRINYQKGRAYSIDKWRGKVLERDSAKCQNCLNTIHDSLNERRPRLEAHHIIPRSEGGRNTLANGIALCSFCHYYIGQAYLNHGLDFRQLEAIRSRVQRISESRKALREVVLNNLRSLAYA